MLLRPDRWPEWIWAVCGAAAMLLVGAVSPQAALTAAGDGVQVYAFLAGIMVLAEIARRDGVFTWIVEAGLRIADGSRARLFTTVYGVGVVVTALLSNDTTAVVLTPAILTALAQTDADPLPYLYACAFVAGAASFVLPISNPANLVVFDGHLPPLAAWIAAFGLSALLAVVLRYFALRVLLRKKIVGNYALKGASAQLDRSGKVALTAVGSAALLLVIANVRGGPIGTVSLAAGACALIVVSLVDRRTPRYVARHASWGMIPLVAGLFVVVAGLNATGALSLAARFFSFAADLPTLAGNLAIVTAATLGCNLVNNLPVALFAGSALRSVPVAAPLAHVTLVAVDLGPNLSITGSLATILWLSAVRREGILLSPWRFLKIGAWVTLPVLILAALAVR